MKRFLSLLALCAMLLGLAAINASAASVISGTESYTRHTPRESVAVITVTWTASSDGSVASETIDVQPEGYVFMVVTNPGGTAPTALYDITLTDSDGVDIMGGTLANRSATLSEQAVPAVSAGLYGPRYVAGDLTLNISGNSANAATGTVVIYVAR